MINKQLLDYIEGQLKQGVSRDQITASLVGNGWQASDVAEAFGFMGAPAAPTPPVTPPAPVSAPAHQETQAAVGQMAPPPQSRVLSIVVTVIMGVVFLAGGAFAAYTFTGQSAERAIFNMFEANAQLTSVTYRGEVEIEIKAPENQPANTENFMLPDFTLDFNFSGKTDLDDRQNPIGEFALALQPNFATQMAGITKPVSLEIRLPGNQQLYLKADGLPEIFNLHTLNNQWLTTVLKEIAKQYAPDELTEKINEIENSKPERWQIERMWRAAIDTGYLTITKAKQPKTIPGVATHHYQFAINMAAAEAFILKVQEMSTDPTAIDEVLYELRNAPEELTSLVIIGELWIGKKDSLLYKFETVVQAVVDADSGHQVQSRFKLEFSNHNQPVVVEVPANAKNIEEAINGLFGGFGTDFESTDMEGLESDFPQISDELPLMWLQRFQRANYEKAEPGL